MSEEKLQPWQIITETGNINEEEIVEGELEGDEPEYSEAEQKAMEKGWLPEDRWEGNPDDWRPAKEFLDRSSFFDKISNQRREIDALKNDLSLAKEHLLKIREYQNKDVRTRIQREKAEALEMQEFDKVVELDNQIRELENESRQQEPEPQQNYDPNTDPLFVEWKSENPWYDNDPELRMVADGFGISYRQNNPQATAEDLYEFVTSKVKQTHPHKFKPASGQAQTRTPGTASAPQSNRGSRASVRDLNEDQLRIAKRFVRHGLYKDVQEYVDELASIGEI